MVHRWGCLKKWVGLVTAVGTLRRHRPQSVVRAARSRSSQEGRDGWATWPNTCCHPVSAEAGHVGRDPPPQHFWGCGSRRGSAPLCMLKGWGQQQAASHSPGAEQRLPTNSRKLISCVSPPANPPRAMAVGAYLSTLIYLLGKQSLAAPASVSIKTPLAPSLPACLTTQLHVLLFEPSQPSLERVKPSSYCFLHPIHPLNTFCSANRCCVTWVLLCLMVFPPPHVTYLHIFCEPAGLVIFLLYGL